jgi:hypothetical protein
MLNVIMLNVVMLSVVATGTLVIYLWAVKTGVHLPCHGATTFSIMTLSTMTFGIITNKTQHLAQSIMAEHCCAKCHILSLYTECHRADCHGALATVPNTWWYCHFPEMNMFRYFFKLDMKAAMSLYNRKMALLQSA